MNCGRSSSVEWKLPKLQRRVRFPSPAPPPSGRAPGGFVMPASRVQRGLAPPSAPEGTPRAHKRMRHRAAGNCTTRGSNTAATGCRTALCSTPPPLATWRVPRRLLDLGAVPVGAKNLAQHGPSSSSSVKKLAQQEPGHLIFGTKFAQLARNAAFSHILRVRGEFCLVFDDSKPSRANFVSQTY